MTLSLDALRSPASRLLLVLLSIVFVLTLLYSLEHIDSLLFGWLGLQFDPPKPFWYGLSMVMAVLPSLWMPIKLKRPSQFAYWVMYIMIIVPAMLVPYHVLDRPPDEIIGFTATLLGCFFLLSFSYKFPRVVIPRPEINPVYFYVAVGLTVLIFALITWWTVGFSIDLGIDNIYERRHAARNVFQQESAVSYIKGNLASALAPFAIAIGFVRKQWVLFAIGIFGALIVFSVEGSRSAAFLPVFIFGLYPVITKFKNHFGFGILGGVTLLLILSIVLFISVKFLALPLIVSWRMLLVKGLLSSYYWDFFSTHQHVYFSDGILRAFYDNPYPLATPRMIGLTYFNNPETNSNANIFAAAFGDFGYVGMVFITLVTGVFFRFIDSLSHNRGFLITVFMGGFLGVKWTDVAFDTAILSHGTLVMVILLLLTPKPAEETEPEPTPELQEATA